MLLLKLPPLSLPPHGASKYSAVLHVKLMTGSERQPTSSTAYCLAVQRACTISCLYVADGQNGFNIAQRSDTTRPDRNLLFVVEFTARTWGFMEINASHTDQN